MANDTKPPSPPPPPRPLPTSIPGAGTLIKKGEEPFREPLTPPPAPPKGSGAK